MKFLSSVESWNSMFEWGSLVLVAGTVAFGAGAILTSRIIKARQEASIGAANVKAAEANKAAAEANERAAKLEKEAADAQLQLLTLRRFVREPRNVDRIKSKTLLSDRPKGVVTIKFLDGVETERLANELGKNLTDNGWQTSIEKAGQDVISFAGIGMVTSSKRLEKVDIDSGRPTFFEEPGKTLWLFLDTCVEGTTEGWATENPSLPPNASIVLIGPKVW